MAKDLDYRIRWLTDTSSLSKVIADTKKVETTIETGYEQIISAARRGELSIKEMQQALRQVGAADENIDQITASLRQADKEAKNLENSLGGVVTQSGRALLRGEREEGRFQSFSLGTLGAIPGLGGSEAFGAASAAFELVDALPNLGFALETVKNSIIENADAIGLGVAGLGGAALIAAPLVLGLVGAVDAYGKSNAVAEERAKSFTEAFKQALEAGTTAQIQELIKRQQNEIRIAEATRDVLQEKAAGAPDQLAAFLDNTSTDLADRLDQAARDIGLNQDGGAFRDTPLIDETAQAYNAQIAEQEKIISQGQVALEAYNLVLGEQSVIVNTAAQAQLDAAEQALEIDRLTKEQREERIRQNERDVDVLTRLIGAGGLENDALQNYANQITALNADTEKLRGVSESYADVLERERQEKEQLTAHTDQYFEALQAESDIRDKIASINQKIADLQLATAEKVLQIETERDERIAQLTADYTDKVGELTADGEQKRLDIIADSNDKIAKLQRDSGRKLFNLVAQRDALAYYLESIQAAQQVQDEKDNAAKALTEQDKAQSKALDSQKKSYDKALQTQNAAAEKAIRAQYDAANRALQLQYSAQQAEQVALQNLQVSLQSIALYGSNGQRVIHTQLWNDLANFAYTGAQNVVGMFMAGLTGGSSQFPTLTSTYGAAIPTTQAAFDRQFDRRMADTLGIGYGQIRG